MYIYIKPYVNHDLVNKFQDVFKELGFETKKP